MVKRVLMVAALALLCSSGMPVKARTDVCIEPFGYVEMCGALCGRQPGSCTAGYPGEYCLLTIDGFGCHDGYDDPCCSPATLF
jgi:hypothetical protein